MATATVIRFPPPPPTRNELSSEQRAKLIRTNNKLGQVLGSTPHVLDLSYIVPKTQIELPPPPKTPTSSRNPFRSHSRSKSVPKVDMDVVRTSAKSPDSVASRASTSSRKSTVSVRVKTDELAWRSPYPAQRPPLLRLSVPNPPRSRKPRLETIPGSPPFDQTTGSYEPPSFSIPSDAAMRREKMRRVRKMLGEGVPTDLVFPSSPEESDSEEDSPLLSTPTSTMSREWLLVDSTQPDINKPLPYKPLPSEPSSPISEPEPTRATSESRETKQEEHVVRRNRLFKERAKERPSKGAKPLESIAESAKETRPDSLTCVGVSASAGMSGLGKSRRFVKGELHMDQIGSVWGGLTW